MKKIYLFCLSFILFSFASSFAQQDNSFTLYRYHMNMLNPAYAGVDGETYMTGTLRKQWTGIKEAPETQAVSFATPLYNKLSIGFSVVNDKTFVERQTFFGIDLSYKVVMNEKNNLYLGIKGGGNFYSINTAGLETYNIVSDPSLDYISNFSPNIGIGALWKGSKYFVSLSVPKLLNTNKAKVNDYAAVISDEKPHIYLSSGYDFDLNATTQLKPSFLLRYVNGAPLSVDINALLSFNKNFEIGATYRTDQAYAIMTHFVVSKRMLIGYAYELSSRATLGNAKSTHELMMRFKF